MNKKYLILIVVSIASIVGSIRMKVKLKNEREKYIEFFENNLQKLNKIDEVLLKFKNIEQTKNNNNFLFIYQHYDCPACIRIGFEILDRYYQKKYYILHLRSEKKSKYNEFLISSDNLSFFLEKLSFINTPVILKFDNNFNIIGLFFPGIQAEEIFKRYLMN